MQEEPNKYVKELTQEKYKYGFTTDVFAIYGVVQI